MRLFRHGPPDVERPGVALPDGTLLDVSAFGEDFGEQFFGSEGLGRLASWLSRHAADCPRLTPGFRFASCVARPCKIVGIGRNYPAHAAEAGSEQPAEPILFMKASSALCGPNDDLRLPPRSTHTDWEVELAVVIGRTARYVVPQRALEYVAGFALFNDYSERSYQRQRSGQWTKGKSADTFAPTGPFLVTEGVDHRTVELWLGVNGVERQRARTSSMLFDVPTLIAYVSEFMTLLPGDIVATGTPEGVGSGQKPPVYLAPGDTVEYGASGLGEARQRVVAWGG